MTTHHACPLCGFSREDSQPTVLDPACPTCGATLAPVAARPVAGPDRLASLWRERWFERLVIALLVAPLLFAAAKTGWTAAGPAAAAGALVLATLAAYVALAPATRHR
jgi:hypothetical protein